MADTATAGSVQRPLSDAEMTAIAAAIAAVRSPGDLVPATVRALYGALDAGAQLPPDRTRFAIPEAQWLAIAQQCIARGEEFGAGVHAALGLDQVMPARYPDPDVVVAPLPRKDHRPAVHALAVTREAADVIGAASRHCERLARYFGADSPEHLDAARSWHSGLSRLFAMAFGAETRIEPAGELSLTVTSGTTGFVYGVHFLPVPPLLYPPDAPSPGRWESVF